MPKKKSNDNEILVAPYTNRPFYYPASESDEPNAKKAKKRIMEIDATKISSNPLGIKIISLYQVLLSIFLLYAGYIIYTNYIRTPYQYTVLFAYMILIIGFIGIFAGIFLFLKIQIGYRLSVAFLILTGIGLCWIFFIPSVIMFFCLNYFDSNDSFNFIFKKDYIMKKGI